MLYVLPANRLNTRKGGPVRFEMFSYQLEFQKRFHKNLCFPPQITLPGECWKSQWPTESATKQSSFWGVSLMRQNLEIKHSFLETRWKPSINYPLCVFKPKWGFLKAKLCSFIINGFNIKIFKFCVFNIQTNFFVYKLLSLNRDCVRYKQPTISDGPKLSLRLLLND